MKLFWFDAEKLGMLEDFGFNEVPRGKMSLNEPISDFALNDATKYLSTNGTELGCNSREKRREERKDGCLEKRKLVNQSRLFPGVG